MKDTLLSDDAQQHLWNTPELDYLTHVVFRMYENKRYELFSSALILSLPTLHARICSCTASFTVSYIPQILPFQ